MVMVSLFAPLSSLGLCEAQMGKLVRRVRLVSEDHSAHPNSVLDLPYDLDQDNLPESPFLHLKKVNIKMLTGRMLIILGINRQLRPLSGICCVLNG